MVSAIVVVLESRDSPPCFYFCNHIAEEDSAGCFTLIVFSMSRGCLCSVPLPYSVVSWSAVFCCGSSWSYSLTVCIPKYKLKAFLKKAGVLIRTKIWIEGTQMGPNSNLKAF